MGKVAHFRDRLRPKPSLNHPTMMKQRLALEATTEEVAPVSLPVNAELDPLRGAGLIIDSYSIDHFVVGLSEEQRIALIGKTEEEAEQIVQIWSSLKSDS